MRSLLSRTPGPRPLAGGGVPGINPAKTQHIRMGEPYLLHPRGTAVAGGPAGTLYHSGWRGGCAIGGGGHKQRNDFDFTKTEPLKPHFLVLYRYDAACISQHVQ